MTFTDLAKAHVRTIVPILVGLVITLALRAGVDLHGYTPFVTSAVTSVYYTAARLAEHYLSPKFGWLLGVAAAPTYAATGKRTAHKDAGATTLGLVLVVLIFLIAFSLGIFVHPLFFILLLLIVVVLRV